MSWNEDLLKELGLPPDKTHETYSTYDVSFIKNHYEQHTDSWIAFMLNRTEVAIKTKRKELGYEKYKKNKLRSNVYNRHKLSDVKMEIARLVNFIETTKSVVWRDIANRRRKDLIEIIKNVKEDEN